MLISLLRKARADIVGRPLQTGLVFVVVALATAILATALTTQVTVDRAYETRLNESNGAHVWFYYLPGQSDETGAVATDPAALEAIGDRPEVTGASGLIPYVRRSPAILGDGTSVDLRLYGLSSVLPEVGKPILTEGSVAGIGGQQGDRHRPRPWLGSAVWRSVTGSMYWVGKARRPLRSWA